MSKRGQIEEINRVETELLKDLYKVKAKNRSVCPFVKGDIFSINNHLRNEFGKVGKVNKIGNRLVTIVNSGINKSYSRVWWNLKLIESVTAPPALTTPK